MRMQCRRFPARSMRWPHDLRVPKKHRTIEISPMKIAYLAQRVDSVSGIGRFLRALGREMIERGREVHCVSQTCDEQSLRWHRVPSSHVSNGLDKLWYRLLEAKSVSVDQCTDHSFYGRWRDGPGRLRT